MRRLETQKLCTCLYCAVSIYDFDAFYFSSSFFVHAQVDFFRSFIDDPYVFGIIAANHALSDCHAMCAEARTALAIAVVPYAVESKVEEALFQMMAGACSALAESGCALVGGHSCEGTELALGFCINGAVEQERALRKGGMTPGDCVVLTKAIGTGTLFAAEMRMKAKVKRSDWL